MRGSAVAAERDRTGSLRPCRHVVVVIIVKLFGLRNQPVNQHGALAGIRVIERLPECVASFGQLATFQQFAGEREILEMRHRH